MAVNPLIFADAEKARDAITAAQMYEIRSLYNQWADEIGDMANYYAHKSTASSVLAERQMKDLQKQLKATSHQVSNEIYSGVKSSMYMVSEAVVGCNEKWMASLGFDMAHLSAAFTSVPDDIVRLLVTGQVYESGWSLSSRIWGDNEQTLKDIYQVVAKGVAENLPIYDIAKQLEAYVRPEARLPWNLTAKDGVRIFKKQVDYNAQRLARTLIQHTYQQTFIATTKNNPFIMDYIWEANGSRVCQLCMDRDGQHFKKDELPLDHPNGMCTMVPNVVDNLEDQLVDWFNSPDGTYPEIDEFSKKFGYEPIGSVKAWVDKYGTSTKSGGAWYSSLNPIQKAEAKALKDAEGLSWGEWYQKYVYAGQGTIGPGGKIISAPMFTPTQDKYLSPYGFSPTNMPKTFDEWSHLVSHQQASEILKLMGTDWSDPHPYQQLMKYYNQNLVGTGKTPTPKAPAKSAPVGTPQTFDLNAWRQSLKQNDLRQMDGWTRDWLKVITGDEKRGVQVYTGSAYIDMNKFLRGQSSSTSYQDAIDACASALSKASLPRETIVRRGTEYNMLRELGVDVTPQNKTNLVGAIVEDKGFMSTSPAPHGGFTGSIEYVVRLPQGSQAMYVDSISRHQGEEELLINKGGRYMVEDVEFSSFGEVRKIYMTLVNLQ